MLLCREFFFDFCRIFNYYPPTGTAFYEGIMTTFIDLFGVMFVDTSLQETAEDLLNLIASGVIEQVPPSFTSSLARIVATGIILQSAQVDLQSKIPLIHTIQNRRRTIEPEVGDILTELEEYLSNIDELAIELQEFGTYQ